MEIEETPTVCEKVTTTGTTYDWLTANPLASSCGSALSTIYCASRDYNRVTQCTIGSVESLVSYAAGTAKPVYEKVVEKLDTPITAVDGMIAGQLTKLEQKYPVIGEQPGEIATKGKDTVCATLQAGQETLGKTRAGRLVGYGADVTITLAETIVEKVLPPEDKEIEDSEEPVESEETTEETVSAPTNEKPSFFGLRKRKVVADKEEKKVVDEDENTNEEVHCYSVETVPRSTRVYNLSHAVCYRTLRRLQRLQKQCMSSLQQLQATIDVLHYAQMVSSKVGEQKETVTQALKDAEARFMKFVTTKVQGNKDLGGLVSSSSDTEEEEDIKWLLESGKKKDLYQRALEYSQSISKKIYELMQSFSGPTSYLPQGLRDGATGAIKQAKDVYTTLKENNVPSELPWFMLSQISEIVETQITYCKQIGVYITSTLKTRFGKGDSVSDPGALDEDEVDVDDEREPDEGEIESGNETFD